MSEPDFDASQDADDSDAETNGDGNGKKYERSSIAFPYGSLKDAEEIVRSLHTKWGDSADLDQLAAGMQTTKSSGAFRAKVSTAKTFGVIEGSRGRVALTANGKQLLDPATAANARVEAFLRVPLFKELYERKKAGSGLLPPDAALENEIRELGVSSRQTDRARQAFQRSAEQAGFFAHGRDRLTLPNTGKPPERDPNLGDQGQSGRPDDGGIVANMSDPLIAIWEKLLNESASMSAEQIKAAVEAARALRDALSG
jgi:hypothetical protein